MFGEIMTILPERILCSWWSLRKFFENLVYQHFRSNHLKCTKHKMDDPGESLKGSEGAQNLSTNYNQLLKQIENLSQVQTAGAIQNAEPALQAAYVARLQQQASQIKQLLKILNSSGANGANTSNNDNANVTKSSSDANANNGYESLWEVGLAKNIQGEKSSKVFIELMFNRSVQMISYRRWRRRTTVLRLTRAMM